MCDVLKFLDIVTRFSFYAVYCPVYMYILDVSGIFEKFNVYATLAIIPRTKEINKAL